MRKRAGALIVQKKKLLLICETNQGFYWTPGGGLEEGESFLKALVRELKEELSVEIKTVKPFYAFIDQEADEEVSYFLVTVASLPQPADISTKLLWYSKADYEQNTILVSKRLYQRVLPELTKADLL